MSRDGDGIDGSCNLEERGGRHFGWVSRYRGLGLEISEIGSPRLRSLERWSRGRNGDDSKLAVIIKGETDEGNVKRGVVMAEVEVDERGISVVAC